MAGAKMNNKIDKKTIDETACEKSFECLTNPDSLCKVTTCIKGEVHFLECSEKECKFKTPFGDDYFCSCPVRKEMYNRYKI